MVRPGGSDVLGDAGLEGFDVFEALFGSEEGLELDLDGGSVEVGVWGESVKDEGLDVGGGLLAEGGSEADVGDGGEGLAVGVEGGDVDAVGDHHAGGGLDVCGGEAESSSAGVAVLDATLDGVRAAE